jgi:hypothetical protein
MVRSLLRIVLGIALVLGFAYTANAQSGVARSTAKTDAQIKQELIRQSILSYAGSCPCPYNTDRAGRSCGKRSAYSRPGGASPVCYESDVTQKMIDDYRAATGARRSEVARPGGATNRR